MLEYFYKICKYLTDEDYRFLINSKIFLYKNVSDEEFLMRKFRILMGYELNLDNPQTFNEKLQWLKLHDRRPEYTMMVDKYAVKNYVAEKIGEQYIIPTLGVWDKFDDIDFDQLPDQFVLKCTHDSGGLVICRDKSKFDVRVARKKINRCLKRNYYWSGREWPYKNVKPRIIAEKYICDLSNSVLTDYKFMCFNGKIKCIFTVTERFSKEGLKVTFFDCDWNSLPFSRHYPKSCLKIQPPINLKMMIKSAESLTANITFLRVDFYEVGDKIYLGELTFYPGSGLEKFNPPEWDYKLGKWIDLKLTSKGCDQMIFTNNPYVAVAVLDCYDYPAKDQLFRPGKVYPEYPHSADCIFSSQNRIYSGVRQSLFLLGLDKEHFGTQFWNPLKDFIKSGGNVLIKPNLVMHQNLSNAGTDCLYTQPSVVAAIIDYVIIDYVIIALKGRGKIIIGDAPMQDCNFDKLIEESGYKLLVEWYKEKGYDIELVDFRELKSEIVSGIRIQKINDIAKGTVINLESDSEFSDMNKESFEKFRITNYDPDILKRHHTTNKHEYYISDYVLNADCIINMPKPKTHRKAGVTISLKNIVGINVRKEYLPHHTMGSIEEGVDEYAKKSAIHRLRSSIWDRRNKLNAQKNIYHQNFMTIYQNFVLHY